MNSNFFCYPLVFTSDVKHRSLSRRAGHVDFASGPDLFTPLDRTGRLNRNVIQFKFTEQEQLVIKKINR